MSSAIPPRSVPAVSDEVALLSRKEFPDDFIFGFSASAFQYEGAHDQDGKGVSIWDKFLKERFPELVEEDKALDGVRHYYHSLDDVKILKQIGADSHRFSISWPRVLPNGRRTKGPNGEEQGVNQLGINFYNKFINELINNQIEPVICLYHWDLPQVLEDEYLGFLCDKVVDDFLDFADLCFREFGDRVKKWFTFNEPWTFAYGGYVMGYTAPGRGGVSIATAEKLPRSRATSNKNRCKEPTEGHDPWIEGYAVVHNILLAHAAGVKLYRAKYQKVQNGQIGIIANSFWAVPYEDIQEDKDAAIRAVEFMLGWVVRPLIFGDYPEIMKTLVGKKLPIFTPDQAKDLKGSYDFLGLNYYTSNYAEDKLRLLRTDQTYNIDSNVLCHTEDINGVPIGGENSKGGSDWLYSYPEGLKEVLLYIAENYNNPPIYITENGFDELNDETLSLWETIYDYPRISYHYKHLLAVKEALAKGANVKGYYAWSLLDNLEGSAGFHTRFGINYVHFGLNYWRFPKLSAAWFTFFLKK